MCRHLAYLGPPVTLYDLLFAPSHGLCHQSYAPRRQRHGTINADGFGVGWYPAGSTEPVRYRRAMPMWADTSFAEVAATVRSGCVLAAVRDATPGFGSDESCAQPFRGERWLFSHNGALDNYPAVDDELNRPPPSGAMDARAPVDSAALFGLALRLWRDETPLGSALDQVVRRAQTISGGRYNLLTTDGSAVAATAVGDSLYVRTGPDWVMLASEPCDDDPAWEQVPQHHLVTVEARPGSHTMDDTTPTAAAVLPGWPAPAAPSAASVVPGEVMVRALA